MSCKDCFHKTACLTILKASFPTLKEDEIERTSERDNNCKRFVPAADVAEVRHGYWKDRFENKYANHYYECSVCGGAALDGIKNNGLGNPESIQVLSDFCPHCGAKMDGEENKQ